MRLARDWQSDWHQLSFQMNDALICKSMMAVFVLDGMLVNTAFQSAFLNDIVTEHPKFLSGMRFRIMEDKICCELMVISIATGTFVKF